MTTSSDRRGFLKALPGGVGAAAAVAGLGRVRSSFAQELAGVVEPSTATGFEALRDSYGLAQGVSYFNHGSIGTIPRPVLGALRGYLELCETNPWLYMWGGEWEQPRESARGAAAKLMGCHPEELALTHNTTEGFNTLASGLSLGPQDEVLFSTLNHVGASVCWDHYAEVHGYSVRRFRFPIEEVPGLSVDDVLELHAREIRPNTRVLVFPDIDNMVGLRVPAKELTALAKRSGVELVAVDGAQRLGMVPVDVSGMGADFYAASPHKWLQSPKGLGVLYVRRGVLERLRPLWVTWGHERWSGSARVYEDYGTRNLPETLALGDAIAFQEKLGAETKLRRYEVLWQHLRERARERPHVEWLSPERWELASSLYSIRVRGHRSRDVFDALYGGHGFVFRPFSDPEFDAMRLSLNVFNTFEEIDRFFELIDEAVSA